ncbi:MAG: ATP-binding cassette domain-containing protein [Thermogemmatispora sp.]|uniref:ATP-binding cassette domain-containing protein n=1 Tax=Thermogemmatispora sp. TaxID=1968838 RepID=UPI0019EB02BC|nr:ATP-binding cassette domain-containing protein [Thermogemmatispora sp.]MBE3567855.1 ATP-binding cassette domain-containing protein [Thermogemmatispora sp.]
MSLISVSNLWKSYRWRGRSVEALRGLSLSVSEGECFGLLGPNGAGKTTLLRILATLLPPDRGNVAIAGADLRRHPERVRRTVGYVCQQGGTDIQTTVFQDLLLQAHLYGLRGQAAWRRVSEVLEQLELNDLAGRPVSSLSGGQRRRLDLALGLVHRPPLLLLDEPSLGLDPVSRRQLWDCLSGLRAQGATIVLTTHYLDEADQLCTRVAIIDKGSIIADGSPARLKQESAGETLILTLAPSASASVRQQASDLLGTCPFVRAVHQEDSEQLRLSVEHGESALPAVLRLLEEAGLTVSSLVLERPSLDDVFYRYTGRSLKKAQAEAASPGAWSAFAWKGR